MSVERSWEEMQRHGQDLADRLAQGFTGFTFPWPSSHTKNPSPASSFPPSPDLPVAAILDIGSRLGQAGAEFSSSLGGVVQQFFRRLPVPFQHEETTALIGDDRDGGRELGVGTRGGGGGRGYGLAVEQIGGRGFVEGSVGSGEVIDEDAFGLDLRAAENFGRPQGSINITSTYDSRTRGIESSLVARGDLWRAEASHGGSSSGNENSPLFLIQLGPVLFVRDTTLLLPVHLSKQHLLWYGYDRKNGMHSLCPALWSKHRRWLLMSMLCLNPFACSFLDLQFPNGQLTYVAGEGLTTSAFLPVLGGLLQAQGQFPGETRISFACKNRLGTRITPMVQLPDKSFSLELVQALAWRRSGLMVRPSIQFSICPTYGGSNPGLCTELIHSVRDKLSLICGCSCSARSTAFASVSLGRSKWNGNVGSSGVVVRVETPLGHIGRPSYSIQLNSGVDICPTYGGSDPGLCTELIHSVRDKLSLICGCSCSARSTAFASVSLGRSKWNGNVGSSGVVVRVETPLGHIGRPSYSIQLNSGVEF